MSLVEIIDDLVTHNDFKENVKYLTKTFLPGQVIQEQGTMPVHIYLIKKGKVNLSINCINHYSSHYEVLHPTLISIGPGEFVCELSLFEKTLSPTDVIAAEDCDVVEFEIESLKCFLEKHPEIAYYFMLEIIKSHSIQIRHAEKAIGVLYAWGLHVHHID
ncbi:MAG: cyclic nucleotide-binding domain-containing protein [Gammaproteobacteria bacterium]|nr:cyclic nucleotide-binding domain-containing protein [Gammaproteobacteria bacterium]